MPCEANEVIREAASTAQQRERSAAAPIGRALWELPSSMPQLNWRPLGALVDVVYSSEHK